MTSRQEGPRGRPTDRGLTDLGQDAPSGAPDAPLHPPRLDPSRDPRREDAQGPRKGRTPDSQHTVPPPLPALPRSPPPGPLGPLERATSLRMRNVP